MMADTTAPAHNSPFHSGSSQLHHPFCPQGRECLCSEETWSSYCCTPLSSVTFPCREWRDKSLSLRKGKCLLLEHDCSSRHIIPLLPTWQYDSAIDKIAKPTVAILVAGCPNRQIYPLTTYVWVKFRKVNNSTEIILKNFFNNSEKKPASFQKNYKCICNLLCVWITLNRVLVESILLHFPL